MKKQFVFLGMCLVLAGSVMAANKYVDVNATGANNGTSWTDAWTSMNTAMANAAASDTINVAAGTYVAPTDGWAPTNSNLTLIAKTGDEVILSGDTNGDDTFADLLTDPCALNLAYSSGDHSDNTRILNLSSKNMTISDVTFQGGTINSNGGAISTGGSTVLTINNCLFTQCYADGKGGAIYHNSTGNLTMNDCRFIQTSSWNQGAAVRAYDTGQVTMANCLVQATITIDYSGAVYLSANATANSITDTIFDRCRMCNNTGGGGGIMTKFDVSSTLTVTNCVFIECKAYHHGAALYLISDELSGGTITGNVSNCLVTGCSNFQNTGNDLAFHGEIYQTGTTLNLNLTNCTVADNHTNGQGHIGGWCYGNDATCNVNINLKNCIVWGNTGGSGNAQLMNDTNAVGWARVSISADYSCWDNSDPNDWGNAQSLGTGNLLKTADASLDPGFEVGLLSAYALNASSPCIDTGDSTSDYSAEPKCNGGRINMGVYGGTAYATPTATSSKLADLDCDNDVDLADFSVMSSQWLQ